MAANEQQSNKIQALRHLELRLFRCSLPSDHPAPPPSPTQSSAVSSLLPLINDVVTLIESGQYVQALSSSASQTLFSSLQFGLSESAQQFYSESLPHCANSFLDVNEESWEDTASKALLVVAVAVAALLAFTQCNVTGPQDKLPLLPLVGLQNVKEKAECCSWVQWEAWSVKELMSVGSDLHGNFSNLQYLVFAKTLLMRTKDLLFEKFSSIDGVRTISWWLARVLFLQQRLLDDHSSFVFDLLQVFMHESLCHMGSLENLKDYWGTSDDSSTILSMFHLELGIMELYYGRVDSFRKHFEAAAAISNYNFFVSGSLGFRTVHQVEPKPQLRLVASSNHEDTCASLSHKSNVIDNSPHEQPPETSDVLMTPRFIADMNSCATSEHNVQNHVIATTQLKGIHQAMILANCFSIQKIARHDDLQKWEMAPYIEAIDSQHSSPFILQCFCNIMRIRWESTRGRTKQRALLMMENLVENIRNFPPGVAERIYYCFGVNMPTIPALRKEYGDLLVSCGLIGEAVKVYEDLELWDNLIYCYQLMDKKAAAVELIRARLSENPSDPRLWCSLGDSTNDDTSYEKALEVSGNRSARAFRSLARSAYNRGDYAKSKLLWESAMSLNSMHPEGWFALGAAALKARDVEKALDAFTRAVQLDPDNGEAWNNIACLHMIKKRNKEAFIAFKEALKLKRDSWQMWENYSHVAADIGNFSQALEAVKKVLDMTKKKRVDIELLERIVLDAEGRVSTSPIQSLVLNDDSDHTDSIKVDSIVDQLKESTRFEAESSRTRETEHLINLLGQVLRQIVQSGGTADSWGLYARWHKLKGDLTMCSEALLKQVRSYQGSDLWKDREQFVKFAHASLELCRVYKELALRGSSRKELFTAEMHLKSTIKQAVSFSDTKEYRELTSFLEEVQGSLKATSLPGP
ncbi:tetratricopeptide repeat protein 27 [Dorcoceras hygrometricum]|uniref:Tetratricopeptide repeat protein 27 n=1 Tax=Dorcoceras hygrometricum TaxID=472368 RepID=A0A2Z7CQ76_9LAMI|nr:tetratricopeptide repeat protein 27 [Dorcoceras hygrometricum]